jgi:hypothetical protein
MGKIRLPGRRHVAKAAWRACDGDVAEPTICQRYAEARGRRPGFEYRKAEWSISVGATD